MADQQFRVKNGISIGTSSFVDVNRNIVAGIATFNNLKVVGIATLGIISATTTQSGLGIVTFQTRIAIQSGTETITISPPSQNSGFVTSYNLTLPYKLGTDGQVLTLGQDGILGFNTAGLYEARYYVSAANGSDNNDGRSKPFKTIRKAAQAASFRSFQLPGGRYLDAGNLLNVNKTFIQEEVVGFVTFTYPSLLTNLDYDATICKRDVGYVVDAIVYDLSYGGNSKSVEAGLAYWNAGTSYVAGESVETIAAYRYIIDLSKKIINNIGVTTSYQLPSFAISQIFDNTISYDNSCNPSAYSENCCANVLSAIDSYVGIVTSIIGIGTTAAPTISNPTTKSKPIAIFVEAGDYVEDNPILLYDDIAIVGDNIRNTIIRPQNAGKDLFRVRNGCYVTGFAMKDYADAAGVPQFTFDNAVSFDDPSDTSTSRANYASKTTKPIITRSPYIQNCSILSFLGANGIFVDGSKVLSPNQAIIKEESENPVIGAQPQFGKSMVAAAFTMVSFNGIGWRTINDGYAQVVSCFQIFCKYGSLTQSGGYLSITNSATNFGLYALRSSGFSQNSFVFDRGRIAATGTSSGLQTLRVVGLGRSDQNLYVLRFVNGQFADATSNFKPIVTQAEFNATTGINTSSDRITIIGHPFLNGDTILYIGDENASPKSVVGGLISGNQYYLSYIDTNNFQLYEDNSLTRKVNLISSAVGINTIQKGNSEFFVKEVIDAHTSYQNISIGATAGTPQFTSGKQVTQVVTGGTAVGYAVTYNASKRELLISVESQGGIRKFFGVSGSESNLSIQDHSSSPISLGITAVTGISTYHTVEFTVDSTVSGTTITGIASLPKNYQVYFNRPSTINANAHAWEYSGSGTDYNALPQNGGKTVSSSEQVNELGGRVYSTGTNELGDFKVGNFITAYNRTGNIIFNNKVTIGQIDSLTLSLSGGVSISQFSTDVGLGDNEIGGAQNYRVATQLATRTFLGNRLGNFIDKTLSSNAVPSAVVQLNSFGQINSDLIPPKIVNYYRANVSGGRTDIVNQIPATNIQNGDTVLEPGVGYVLIADTYGQYLILNDTTRNYNFNNDDVVISTNSGGGAIGIVTTPPVNAVGYGTTGLVKGVLLNVTVTSGGSGYTNPGIYTCVLDNATGIGTSARAAITVGASGTVTSVNVNFGGRKYASGDIITINTPSLIGGRTGGANFTATVSAIETRLYLKLTNNQKFVGSSILSDYIADNDAIGITTNIQVGYGKTFDPTDVSTGGSIDFNNDRIIVGLSTFTDGDPVIYSANGGNVLVGLAQNYTYYAKRVGITSIELYTSYALSSKVNFTGNGSGTHTITRVGINTVESYIVFERHGLGTGDAVKVTGQVPVGITTGNFYFIGSVVPNAFTLHAARVDAVASLNGTSFNPVSFASTGPGIAMTFTKQNVTYSATVNTSSNISDNWTVLASGTIDASNITSGTISPSRLGGGTANSDTFLRGDSNYTKVVSSVGIGTTEPITATATSQDSAPGGIGINTYYGKLNITLNRAASTLNTYSTLGVSKFKTSTFSIGDDGSVSIKGSSNGDVDAATLSGQSGAYYLNPVNFTSAIPISRGGTGLSALPAVGSILQGNGTSYDLVTSPTLAGNLTLTNGGNFVAVGAAITNANITGFGTVNYLGNINAVHTGIVSFTGTGNNINHTSGTATLNNVNVTGVTTVGTLNYTSLSGTAGASIPFLTNTNTVHSGIVTFSGTGNNINCTAGTQVFNNSVFSGISTFLGQVNVGVANYTSATVGGTLQTNNLIVTGVTTAGRLQVSDTIAATTLTVSGVTTVGTLYFTSLGGTAGASIPYLTNTNTVVSGIATFTGTDNNIQQTNGTAALNRLTVSGISTFTGLINYGSISGTTITNSGTAGLTNATVSGVTTFSGSGNNINQSAGTAAINRLTVSGISTFTGQLNAGTISASSLIGTLNNTLTINSPLTGTSYNNSAAVTLGINATSANTANYVVQRGASGEFSMGALTASTGSFSSTISPANGIYLQRVNATNTGINWYSTTLTAWTTYMGSATQTNLGPTNNITAPSGTLVTTWGLRNFIENVGGYGWTFESGTSTGQPTVVAEIRSSDGAARFGGDVSGTTLTSRVATGTAPLTVTSTTQVSNLNAQYHNGLLSASTNTINTIVSRDGNGDFAARNITATSLIGTLNNTLTAGSYLTGTSYNNSTAVTFAVDATSANTASKVVARGASGEFSMGALTASTGSFSSTVSTNGGKIYLRDNSIEDFTTNGNSNIAINYYGYQSGFTQFRDFTVYNGKGGLVFSVTGSTGASNFYGTVTSSSTVTGTQLISNIATGTAPLTVTSTTQVSNLNAQYHNGLLSTTANTGSTIVARDGSGNFSAGTITAALSGNSTTATNLTNFKTFWTGFLTTVTYYQIAQLPLTSASSGDGVYIEVVSNTNSVAGKSKLKLGLGQRDGFWYVKSYEGGGSSGAGTGQQFHIRVYQPTAGGVSNVYLYNTSTGYAAATATYYNYGWGSSAGIGATLYDNPTGSATVPTGTLIFDSATEATYPVNDAEYTGTLNAISSLRSPIFYDSDNTGYYCDPSSTSDSALRIRGGTLYGPNNTWGAYLLVGGYGRQNYIDNTTTASVCTTSGNLHLDAASGYATYLNYYDGTTVNFGSGANTVVGTVNSSGQASFALYYDYNNTAYYTDPASTSVMNTINAAGYLQLQGAWGSSPYGSGSETLTIRSTYASMCQRATNGALSYYLHHLATDGAYYLFGGRGATDGSSWDWSYRAYPNQDGSYVEFRTSARAPIFYDRDDTTYYLDPASTSIALSSNGIVSSGTGTAGGFQNRTYAAGRNRIWSFGNADAYGLSYFQGAVPDYIGLHFGTATQAASQFWVSDSGISQTSASSRAPIFYDSNNTAYYTDPASTSNLNGLTVAATITGSVSGNAATATTAGGGTNSTFFSAGTASEGQIGAQFTGQNSVYLYNNATAWGIYSGTGGSAFTYTRSSGLFAFNGSSSSCSGNAATATNLSNSGTVTLATATESNSIYITQPAYTTDQPVKLLNFDWYGNTWSLGNIRSGSTPSNGFGVYSSGTERARFTTTGLTVAGTVTANSDIKLKTNIKTIPNALDKVSRLRGVEYDRIDIDEHQIGVIAQEIEKIIPEVVVDNNGTKSVAYGNLVGLLIEAIKEQQMQINELKNMIINKNESI